MVLKLKTQDFKLRTRNRQLGDPTRLGRPHLPDRTASLLEKETDGTKFRLLGIGVSDLSDDGRADPPDLVDDQSRKRAMAEGAMDALRDKFGRHAVETGYTFGKVATPTRRNISTTEATRASFLLLVRPVPSA